MRRVAEFRKVFGLETEAERLELAEHPRTLLNEDAGEVAEAFRDPGGGPCEPAMTRSPRTRQ
jgi:hypothetical protein